MMSHKRLFIVAKMTVIQLIFLSTSDSPAPTRLLSLHFGNSSSSTRRYTLKCFQFLDKTEAWSTDLPTLAPGSPTTPSDSSLLFPHPTSTLHALVLTSDAHVFLIGASDGSILTHLRPPAPFGVASTSQLLSVSLSPTSHTLTICLQTKGPEKQMYIRTVDTDAKIRVEFQGLELDRFSGEKVSVAISACGEKTRWLLGGNQGHLFLTAGRTVSQQMSGHQDRVSAISFMSDPEEGRLLSFSESEMSLKLWDVSEWLRDDEGATKKNQIANPGPPRPELLHGQRPIITCATSIDGARLILSTEEGLTFWNAADGRLEASCPVTTKRTFDWKAVERIEAFCSDQYILLQDSYSNKIFIIDVTGEGRVLNFINDVKIWKRSELYSDHLVLVNQEGKQTYMGLQVRRIPNLSPVCGKRFLPPVEISGTGIARLLRVDWLHSDSWDFGIIAWQVGGRGKTKNVAWAINMSEGGSTTCLTPCSLPDTNKGAARPTVNSKANRDALHSVNTWMGPMEEEVPKVMVGSDGGDMPMWDLMTGSCHMYKINYFHSWFKHSVVINLQTQQRKKASQTNAGQFVKFPITALEASKDRSVVISGCSGGRIMCWRWLKILALNGQEPSNDPREYRFELGHPGAHRDAVTCLKLSTDLSLLVSGGADKHICIFGLSPFAPGILYKKIYIHMTPSTLIFDASESIISGKAEEMGEERLFAFHVVRPDSDFPVNRRGLERKDTSS